MKRYDVEDYNIEEHKIGDYILYSDFINLISARIKELEMELADSKDKVGLTKAIVELRKLIK